eukprot:scaffold105399_cov31-Tisochrysis_lutea.AAC.2
MVARPQMTCNKGQRGLLDRKIVCLRSGKPACAHAHVPALPTSPHGPPRQRRSLRMKRDLRHEPACRGPPTSLRAAGVHARPDLHALSRALASTRHPHSSTTPQ